ncbi:pimeloyl-ACP methyl ester carboxylesterase [Cecembia rubra]|uniref:Pimeloyl-ACP methyl ester carboxylesterase n=2 Tax=Cecembia rubra TaxID=1485585 RepID=A0A2P8ED19_9BACT|nr:pimeloyl-ACP methyl ester carboxylesterase [Cecembia rubra]
MKWFIQLWSKQKLKTMKTSVFNYLLVILFACSLQIVNASTAMVNVEVVGKGRPLILVHGMSCDSSVWDEFVQNYKDRYQFHLVSIKGFGNNEKIESPHYLTQIRDEIIAYIKNNSLQNAVFVGHSMGGFLGLWIGAVEQELLSRIISVDGIPYFPAAQMPGITPEVAQNMADQMKVGMRQMSDGQTKANQEMIVAGMIRNKDKHEKVVKMGLNSHPEVVGQAYTEMFTTDIRPLMSKIRTPTLVLGSWAAYGQYGFTKEAISTNFLNQINLIPAARLEMASSAYHFIFYDEPEWFYEQVEKFLSE